MKCPRCGKEMELDTHRKIPLMMCYECGYIEGRSADGEGGKTNYEHLHALNFNEMVSYLSGGLGLDEQTVAAWLEKKL